MANCPKCHKRLRIRDWRQKCPHCGANVVLYDLQERLMLEADKAEVQYYHFSQKIDRVKTAFIGSKLAITRIITSLLPVSVIFLPLIRATFNEPFAPFEGNIGAYHIYDKIDELNLKVFSQLISQAETKTPAILLALAGITFILSLVVMLLHFVFLILACSPKGKIRNYILDTVFLALTLCSVLSITFMPQNSVIAASVGIGAYLYLALVLLNFIIDVAVFREGLEVIHTQCFVGGIPIEEYFEMVDKGVPQTELRAEMYKRLTALQEEKDAVLKEKQKKMEQKEERVNV